MKLKKWILMTECVFQMGSSPNDPQSPILCTEYTRETMDPFVCCFAVLYNPGRGGGGGGLRIRGARQDLHCFGFEPVTLWP